MPKKDFLHELRNRLTIIKGNLDLIDENRLPADDKKFLRQAKAEFAALAAMLKETER